MGTGRLNSPYKSSTVKWDPFLATFMQARGNEGVTAAGHNGYVENVVAYANKFGKAKFVAAIGLDESNDNPNDRDTDADHALTASVNMPVGPVEMALAYVNTAGIGGTPDTPPDNNQAKKDGEDDIAAIKIGAKFKTGALTLAGQYETVEVGGNAAFDQIFFTGSYKVSANTFSLSYGTGIPDVLSAVDGRRLFFAFHVSSKLHIDIHKIKFNRPIFLVVLAVG